MFDDMDQLRQTHPVCHSIGFFIQFKQDAYQYIRELVHLGYCRFGTIHVTFHVFPDRLMTHIVKSLMWFEQVIEQFLGFVTDSGGLFGALTV